MGEHKEEDIEALSLSMTDELAGAEAGREGLHLRRRCMAERK
jgi:hypothetical protein